MKRFCCLVMSLFLCLGVLLSNGIDARANDNSQVVVTEKSSILTRQEAIKLVSEKQGISIKEAEKQFANSNKNTFNILGSKPMYQTYAKTFNYPGGVQIELGGVWELYTNGSFRQLNCISSKWCKASGSGVYEWDCFHVTDATGKYPTTCVNLKSRGAIVIKVSKSQTSTIGVSLEGLGFSLSSTSGQTYYYRKTVDLQMTKDIYR